MTAQPRPFDFDNSYARLPDRFSVRQAPVPVSSPALIRLNNPLALALGLDPDALEADDAAAIFAGNEVPQGAEPLAMAYAGHQFGHFVPQLGDGRALLLGEVIGTDGIRYDIQLKGSGRTPFSRGGDGRAALGPVVREYVISEAMAGLGIATSRALAMALTGDHVLRDQGPEPGAVLCRVAKSHVRVGTFQFFASRGDRDAVKALADYVHHRHPGDADTGSPYLDLLQNVIARTAKLVASWQLVGFIHGVMNTDNMQLAGETIDFGPCAFLDHYQPDKVFSSIDQFGRYAYANQPKIALWNMARLAECLLPLIDADEQKAVDQAEQALAGFSPILESVLGQGWRAKLGLTGTDEADLAFVHDLLDVMADHRADFTRTFRALSELSDQPGEADQGFLAEFSDHQAANGWLARWRGRLVFESRPGADRSAAMRAVNPAFIARNHQVQRAIDAAYDVDYAPIDRLLTVLRAPFDDHPGFEDLATAPTAQEEVRRTFCGT